MPGSNVVFAAQSGQAANRGQSVLVTLDLTDQAKLTTIKVGDEAINGNSGNVGYVSEIDILGGTLKIKPQYPYSDFSSDLNPLGSIMTEGTAVNVTTN